MACTNKVQRTANNKSKNLQNQPHTSGYRIKTINQTSHSHPAVNFLLGLLPIRQLYMLKRKKAGTFSIDRIEANNFYSSPLIWMQIYYKTRTMHAICAFLQTLTPQLQYFTYAKHFDNSSVTVSLSCTKDTQHRSQPFSLVFSFCCFSQFSYLQGKFKGHDDKFLLQDLNTGNNHAKEDLRWCQSDIKYSDSSGKISYANTYFL